MPTVEVAEGPEYEDIPCLTGCYRPRQIGRSGSNMKQNDTKRKNFEERTLPHLEGLYRTALYVSDSESDAFELLQETFAGAYHSWHEGQFRPNCRLWLFKIMAEVLRNRHRPSRGLSTVENNADGIDGYLMYSRWLDRQPIDDFGKNPISTISEEAVKKAVGSLPNDAKLIVVLVLLEGFSYRETAEITNRNLETVISRLHQGRKLMQRELFGLVECEGENDMPADRVRSRKSG